MNKIDNADVVPALTPDFTKHSISQISSVIRKDWVDKTGKPNIYFAAKPYVEAMELISNIGDMYGFDNGRDIVARFLCNANSWRGEVAKAVKKELNKRLKSIR